MQAKIAESIGANDAGIFDAHLLVVEDRAIIDEVQRTLHREHRNIESVFHRVASRYADTLSKIDDPYLRERAVDIQDVMRRVLMNLTGLGHQPAFGLAGGGGPPLGVQPGPPADGVGRLAEAGSPARPRPGRSSGAAPRGTPRRSGNDLRARGPSPCG